MTVKRDRFGLKAQSCAPALVSKDARRSIYNGMLASLVVILGSEGLGFRQKTIKNKEKTGTNGIE